MANLEAFCPGHFFKHKPLISEECRGSLSETNTSTDIPHSGTRY